MSENINVYFDKEYKIRVLDPAKYEKSEELEKECGVFVEKVSTFNDKVKDLVTIIEQYAAKIDYHKYNVIKYIYIFYNCFHSFYLLILYFL